MAERSHVPQFGKWEAADDVPYTVYFDKARKGRTGGRIINPNDPQENPDLVPDYAPPAPATPSRARSESDESTGRGAVKRADDHVRSREENDLKQFPSSPARHDNVNRRAGNELAPQRPGGRGVGTAETHRRPGRASAGSENSFERSPLNPHARISGRGGGAPSPAWEGKGLYESGHGAPGRARLRPKDDESPDKGAAVPKFGDWDESNPASADGFTHIFNRVREERNLGGATGTPSRPTEPSHSSGHRQNSSDSSKGCCFPWCR